MQTVAAGDTTEAEVVDGAAAKRDAVSRALSISSSDGAERARHEEKQGAANDRLRDVARVQAAPPDVEVVVKQPELLVVACVELAPRFVLWQHCRE